MTPNPLSFAHRAIAVLASLAAFFAAGGAYGHGAISACERWTENRLIIGDLEGRRFDLEASGPVDETNRFDAAEGRIVLHRTFRLFLDAAEPIALFKSPEPRTLILARDRKLRLPLMVPVFFVGRRLQPYEDILADAGLAAFESSRRLHDGDEFSAVQFHLRRGGSRFSDIRPFFACGLAGILLCEGTCPGDSSNLAASLVNWKLSGASPPGATGGDRERPPSAAPLRSGCSEPGLTAPPLAADGDCGTPAAPSRRAKESTPPPPKSPSSPPVKEETRTSPPKPPARLVLSFQTPDGTPIPAADILAAEGRISLEGVFLNPSGGGLGAGLPEDVMRKAKSLEGLRRLFPHYRVQSFGQDGPRTIVIMEPLFVRAAGVRVEIVNGAGTPVSGCELFLHIGDSRRLGQGWLKDAEEPDLAVRFRESNSQGYATILPGGVAENELLINLKQPGDAGHIENRADGCLLEAKPVVTAEELKAGPIRRSLRATGPVLIALFSTDGALPLAANPQAVKGFWSGALDLAGAVSGERWERKLLALAQSFGPMPETRILQDAEPGQKLADGAIKNALLQRFIDGSGEEALPRALLNRKPLERFHLDLALEPLRRDARIDPVTSMKQEALLLITGGGGLQGSYFCREPVPGENSQWITPVWRIQERRIFALEIWSDAETEDLQRNAHAAAPQDAPDGIYRCLTTHTQESNVELYGLAPAALAFPARGATFAYLSSRAKAFLKP